MFNKNFYQLLFVCCIWVQFCPMIIALIQTLVVGAIAQTQQRRLPSPWPLRPALPGGIHEGIHRPVLILKKGIYYSGLPLQKHCLLCAMLRRHVDYCSPITLAMGPLSGYVVVMLVYSLISFVAYKLFFPLSALWSFWYPRGSSKRACDHMTSWMWSSSTLLVIWTCCVASKISRPGKWIIQYVFSFLYISFGVMGRVHPWMGTVSKHLGVWYLTQRYLSRVLNVSCHLPLLLEHLPSFVHPGAWTEKQRVLVPYRLTVQTVFTKLKWTHPLLDYQLI